VSPGGGTLDVVTINLWGAGGPARARMDALADWLAAERPDIVLLQEVERVAGTDAADLLGAAAGYPHVAGIRTGWGSAVGEGLAVLARPPLRPRPGRRLPLAPLDPPRALQQVDVDTPAGTVRLANTHLAWRLSATGARTRQARTVVRALSAARLPVVLGGDLNDVFGSDPLGVLAAAGFVDCCAHEAAPRDTFDAANPYMGEPALAGRRVDHLLVRGPELSAVRVVLDGHAGPVVSDHYGVRALMRVGAG
jgi:endonuclease/exonuclease/phosphatase family metal-dependent hydrolase